MAVTYHNIYILKRLEEGDALEGTENGRISQIYRQAEGHLYSKS